MSLKKRLTFLKKSSLTLVILDGNWWWRVGGREADVKMGIGFINHSV